MAHNCVPDKQTLKHNEKVVGKTKSEAVQHGFPEKQIREHFEEFEKETKAERDGKSYGKFNDAILKAKKDTALWKKCKGIFVGNIFLNNAIKGKHVYLLAESDEFIVIVPFGPIQSVVHVLAIPKIPIYNAVSLGIENALLILKMRAALRKVVSDVLTPNSLPQKIYLRALKQAIDLEANDRQSIRITQGNELDTLDMGGDEAVPILKRMLKDYYDEKKVQGIPLKQDVCTDLHIHPINSVGQLHMHGWIAESSLITDNGKKLAPKNTPVKRIIPVLSDLRGEKIKERRFKVIVKNPGLE